MRMLVVAVAALLVVLLTGCKDHEGEHCAGYNTVLIPQVHTMGKSTYTTYIYVRECNQWVPNQPTS